MNKYKYNICVNHSNKHYGYIEGYIGDVYWYAMVHDHEVKNAIDPVTLESGYGKITKLCLYKDNTSFEGNPYLPSMTVRRQIYVNYQEEWQVLNAAYMDMVKELILYLDRRFSLRIVSC